jgi:DNA ligase-1
MTLARFARMCEVLEYQTPSQKASTISMNLSSFSDKTTVIKILSKDYAVNNIGSKRAITWVAQSLGLFEDEVSGAVTTWADLGEGMKQMLDGENTDSSISITEFHDLISLNCSRIADNSFRLFSEALRKMSALEVKWFLRYWLRKPRNGCGNNVPLKAMELHFADNKIGEYHFYNSAAEICKALDSGRKPECKLTHGNFVSSMLAKSYTGSLPTQYYIDVKYDGNRYQIHKKGESVIIFNRKGKVVTEQFPDVMKEVLDLQVDDFIIDTEIYPVNADGTPAEHKMLGKRVHSKDKAKAVEECAVKMVAFDLLSWNGRVYLDDSLRTRLYHLGDLLPDENIAKSFPECTIQSAYNQAISLGFEGIMIKDMNMTYQPGKRSKGWLKHKPPRFNYDVVITSAKYGEGKRGNVYGTFGIAVKDGNSFVDVGNVGTGFSDEDLTQLHNSLRKIVDYYEGDTYYFLPRVVLEVTCDLVTNDANGNIGLRFPRCVRIRNDKYVSDIDTLESLMERTA